MKNRFLGRACVAAAVLFCGLEFTRSQAMSQDFYPNPGLSKARSASLRNGGIESEFDYHYRANASGFATQFTPISKFSGGVGYCCPTLTGYYYGCDTGRGFCHGRGCR